MTGRKIRQKQLMFSNCAVSLLVLKWYHCSEGFNELAHAIVSAGVDGISLLPIDLDLFSLLFADDLALLITSVSRLQINSVYCMLSFVV